MAKKTKTKKTKRDTGKFVVTQEEYKGHQLLVIKDGENDRYPMRFGLSKAQKVLAVRNEIEEFVADQLEALAKQAQSAGSKQPAKA